MIDVTGLPEDMAKRTEWSKTYSKPNGDKVCLSYPSRQHYMDAGRLVEYAPLWVQQPNGSIVLTGMHFDARINPNSIDYRYGRRDTGAVINFNLFRINGSPTNSLPWNFAGLTIDKNRVGFTDVLPELDVYWVAHKNGMTLHKILKGDLAPRDWLWTILRDGGIPAGINASPRRGAENIEDIVTRQYYIDQHRQLEVEDTHTILPDAGGRERHRYGTRWTGRVASVERGTRIKTWTTDFAYPVRML